MSKKTKKDLIKLCLSRGITTWHEVKMYISDYKKYDVLTLRDIDEVTKAIKNYGRQSN